MWLLVCSCVSLMILIDWLTGRERAAARILRCPAGTNVCSRASLRLRDSLLVAQACADSRRRVCCPCGGAGMWLLVWRSRGCL